MWLNKTSLGHAAQSGGMEAAGGSDQHRRPYILFCNVCKIYTVLIMNMIFKNIFLLVAIPSYYNQDSGTQDRNKSDKNVLQNFFFLLRCISGLEFSMLHSH